MKANSQNPKDVGRPAFSPGLLGYVMNIISNITIGKNDSLKCRTM